VNRESVFPLRDHFGDIDIYLFDQLLRGRIRPGLRVLDAGCGGGRNLIFLLRAGFDVRAADADPSAVAAVRSLASELAPALPADNFRAEPVESMSFDPQSADFVISSAVLHFARDPDHFDAMLRGSWRMLAPRGIFFCRLASSIGIEDRVVPIGAGRYRLPDGSDRFLVDEPTLMRYADELGGRLLDPIKTTVVQGQRSMTTWVLQRHAS
jgi:SAM-dependent methyltransferase